MLDREPGQAPSAALGATLMELHLWLGRPERAFTLGFDPEPGDGYADPGLARIRGCLRLAGANRSLGDLDAALEWVAAADRIVAGGGGTAVQFYEIGIERARCALAAGEFALASELAEAAASLVPLRAHGEVQSALGLARPAQPWRAVTARLLAAQALVAQQRSQLAVAAVGDIAAASVDAVARESLHRVRAECYRTLGHRQLTLTELKSLHASIRANQIRAPQLVELEQRLVYVESFAKGSTGFSRQASALHKAIAIRGRTISLFGRETRGALAAMQLEIERMGGEGDEAMKPDRLALALSQVELVVDDLAALELVDHSLASARHDSTVLEALALSTSVFGPQARAERVTLRLPSTPDAAACLVDSSTYTYIVRSAFRFLMEWVAPESELSSTCTANPARARRRSPSWQTRRRQRRI